MKMDWLIQMSLTLTGLTIFLQLLYTWQRDNNNHAESKKKEKVYSPSDWLKG